MRTRWLAMIPPAAALTCAMAACAADGTSVVRDPPRTEDDAGSTLPPRPEPDAGDSSDGLDAGSKDSGDANLSCNDAGWCETRVPAATNIFAIAPRHNVAFALGWVAQRTTLLAFDGTRWTTVPHEAWDIVPKGKQVLHAVAARGDDEVWVGGAAGRLMRGVRSSGTFTWTELALGTTDVVRSIYVASESVVYVATDSRLLRWNAAIPESFDVEYEEVETIEPHVAFREIVGTGTNELWLVGGRANCAYVARKTSGAWAKVFDSEPFGGLNCDYRPPYGFQSPPFTNTVASGSGELTTLASGLLMRLRPDAPDGLAIDYASVPYETADVWVVPGTTNVFTAGFALVQESQDPWSGSAWNVSSIAFGGKATLVRFNALRGTDANNLWVVGDSYALHKTTP